MKYIYKSLLITIKHNVFASICLVLGFIGTFCIYLFSYGVGYQISNKTLDQVNYVEMFTIDVRNTAEEKVTWDRVQSCYKKLNSNSCDRIVSIYMYSKLCRDESEPKKYTFDFFYSLDKKGNPTYFDMTFSFSPIMYSGRWYSEEEFDNAERVALGSPYEYIDTSHEDTLKFENGSSDKYIIEGEEYSRIGTCLFAVRPMFPVTCLGEDAEITQILIFPYNAVMTSSQYNDIVNVFREEFGDSIKMTEIEIKELDENYYYVITIISILIAVISVIVLSLLISYIIRGHRDVIKAYKIAGIRKGKIVKQLSVEVLLFLILSIIVSIPIYDCLIMPNIEHSMTFFSEAYSMKKMAYLSLAYMAVCYAVTRLLALKEIR